MAFARRSKPLRCVLLGATALLICGLAPATAHAEPDDNAPSKASVQEKIRELGREIERLAERHNEATVDRDEAEADADVASGRASELQREIDKNKSEVRDLATRSYKGGAPTELAQFFVADEPSDLLARLDGLNLIAQHRERTIGALGEAKKAADDERAKAEEAKDQAQELIDQLAQDKAKIERKLGEHNGLLNTLNEQERAQLFAENGTTEVPASTAPAPRQVEDPAPVASQPVAPASAPAPSSTASVAVQAALSKVGSPYVWGAAGPSSFDCSGLMQWSYRQAGLMLPRISRDQAVFGTPVSRQELQPGDILGIYSPVSHVAMYIGNGQVVHSPSPGDVVKVVALDRAGPVSHFTRPSG